MGTIALIGAGQVGSRHAQALARSGAVSRVEVLGRSPASLAVAEERYRQVALAGRQSVLFTRDMAELSDTIDVAIVATNSDTRFDVLHELLSKKHVRALILEKVVFQSAEQFDRAIAELASRQIPAWVNCFRRALPAYQHLRERITTPISLTVTGGEWGLGCNAVHYVDLCAFLAGAEEVAITRAELDAAVLESRRPGFVEFTGRIEGHCADHRFELVAQAGSAATERVTIATNDGALLAEEVGSTVNVGGVETRIPYQSELTDKLVEEILRDGKSALPTLEQSYRIHAPLLEVFTRRLERTRGAPYARCPIT